MTTTDIDVAAPGQDRAAFTEENAPAESWRQRVTRFADREVRPRVREMDQKARVDSELLSALFSGGLMGIEIPARYGGRGGDFADVVTAIEETARVDPAVAVIVDVQNALIASALLRHGSGQLKRRVLPRLTAGVVGAYALSESQAGSDAFAMSTTYRRDGEDYVLDGNKSWITNAAEAGVFLVFAKQEQVGGNGALSAFVVDAGTPGLHVSEPVDKMGIRASSTCEVVLDGVRVDAHALLGQEGDGELLAVRTLNLGKIGIAAQLCGLARGALEVAVSYAQGRQQFGERVGDFQGVQFPLAALAAELDAARALLQECVRAVDGTDATDLLRMAASVKYVASHVSERIATQAVETLGGNGFTAAYPAEKFYRDVKIGKIYEGTSNMQFRTLWAALARECDPAAAGARRLVEAASSGKEKT